MINYDLNYNTLNSVFYSPEDMTSMEISANIYIDRTSIDVFVDGGACSYATARTPENGKTDGFRFWGHQIEVKKLEIFDAA